MAVQQRDTKKGAGSTPAEAAGAASKLLDRLNELGEKHATAIISVSTALIILTVLIFAKYFYDKTQLERAELELDKAETTEQLQELKNKYGSTPAGPRISFRLGNRLYEDGKLDEARKEYQDFEARYPNDRLRAFVERAVSSLDRNARYDVEGKESRLKEYRLLSHPRQYAEIKDPRFEWGPVVQPNPTAKIDLGSGAVKVELFEQDAPNAVAAFVKLAEEKYFNGLKWEIVGDGERIEPQVKPEKPSDLKLAPEDTQRTADAFSLVLVKKDGGVSGAQFQILLRPVPGLKDATVFGTVTEGMDLLRGVKKDDVIKSISVLSKGSHPYEPQPLRK